MQKFLNIKKFCHKVGPSENLINICKNTIKEIKEAGTYKSEKSITSSNIIQTILNQNQLIHG